VEREEDALARNWELAPVRFGRLLRRQGD